MVAQSSHLICLPTGFFGYLILYLTCYPAYQDFVCPNGRPHRPGPRWAYLFRCMANRLNDHCASPRRSFLFSSHRSLIPPLAPCDFWVPFLGKFWFLHRFILVLRSYFHLIFLSLATRDSTLVSLWGLDDSFQSCPWGTMLLWCSPTCAGLRSLSYHMDYTGAQPCVYIAITYLVSITSTWFEAVGIKLSVLDRTIEFWYDW